MLKHKKLIVVAIVVLSAMLFAVPSWSASFRKKTIPDQQFVDMCKEGNTKGVIEAINAGANVKAKDNDGVTALMAAAENGHTQIVNALIKAGADLNAKDNYGWTALIWAAGKGHTQIVNALIKAGADLNAKDNNSKFGWTALMWAAMSGYTETVNALIEAGADDLTSNDGKTALIIAAGSLGSNAETVNALIDAGSYVKQKDNKGNTALDYARENPALKGSKVLKRLEKLSK